MASSYGNAQYVKIGGHTVHVKSDAEARFARQLNAAIQGGLVKECQYEPQAFAIEYKYRRNNCADTYTPDFRVVWKGEEGEVYYEVKRGALQPKYAGKIKRFCQQYPDTKLVLVWVGRPPKRGAVKARFDRLLPHLHHVWYLTAQGKR